MKKNAFSLIELIFVIIILGVLASVAIPKLAPSNASASFPSTNNVVEIDIDTTVEKVNLNVYNKVEYPLKGDLTLRKNIVIVFDDSSSMSGNKIDRARKATITLLKSLSNEYNVAVYGLNIGVVVPLVPVEGGMTKHVKNVQKIDDGGDTPIGDSLLVAIKVLKKQKIRQSGYGTYTIVVVTDGAANNRNHMFKMVNTAIENGIQINTIGLDIGNHGLRQVTKFVEASSTEELTAALKKAVKAEVSEDVGFVSQDF